MPVSAQAFGIKKTMRAIMGSWVGKNIDSVIASWGYPDYEKTIAGRKLYYWNWEYTVGNPTYTNARAHTYGNTTNINAYTYGGGTRDISCNRILEVDESGRVTSWQWSGNNCPYTQAYLYKKWMNPKVLSEVAYQKNLDKQDNDAELNRTMDVTAKYLKSLKENPSK